MAGKTQAELSADHHGFIESPVVTAHGPPTLDSIHLHLYLHYALLRAAATSQAHLQWSQVYEQWDSHGGGLQAGLLLRDPGRDSPLWTCLFCKWKGVH